MQEEHNEKQGQLISLEELLQIIHDVNNEDENEAGDEWSQTSWDRHPYETDEDYEERMEDLGNMLDGWL